LPQDEYDQNYESWFDANNIKLGLAEALTIKDPKQLPNRMDVALGKYIVDILQGGYSAKQTAGMENTVSIVPGFNSSMYIIDPAQIQPGTPFDNSKVELRMLGMYVTVSGFTSIPGNFLDLEIAMNHLPTASNVVMMSWRLEQVATSFYSWNYPSMVLEATGNYQLYVASGMWNGVVPPDCSVEAFLKSEQLMTGAENITVEAIGITVPAGAQLPM